MHGRRLGARRAAAPRRCALDRRRIRQTTRSARDPEAGAGRAAGRRFRDDPGLPRGPPDRQARDCRRISRMPPRPLTLRAAGGLLPTLSQARAPAPAHGREAWRLRPRELRGCDRIREHGGLRTAWRRPGAPEQTAIIARMKLRSATFMVSVAVFATGGVSACTKMPRTSAKPPTTRVEPVKESFHGTEVTDNYRWLEGDVAEPANPQKVTPDVISWTDAQNAYTRAVLDNLPGRKA